MTKPHCRTAFYLRVSTNSDEQENSLENQRQACFTTLRLHPEYSLAGIYQDDGISGTQARKRPGFIAMVKAAEAGQIDLIITKSLSRWSRNTLESLLFVRQLREKGCHFIFERENIDTRQKFSEFILTLYSAFSQEESRSISENTKLGIRMNFRLGKARWCPLYGYRPGYVIHPAEAAVIRDIFNKYEKGFSLSQIRTYLENQHIPSPRGCSWRVCQLQQMLHNEKYAGALIMQKYCTKDHLKHAQMKNDGTTAPIYVLKNHHRPIIPRAQFDKVQLLLCQRRYNRKQTKEAGPSREDEQP